MILAAADYGRGEGEPPPELELALQAHRWGVLPEAGGLRDQPAGLLRRMTAAENVYNVYVALEHSDDYAKFINANPGAARMIEMVNGLRGKHGV
jgi:hypothetical protein